MTTQLIFLVDDDPDTRMLMSDGLRSSGFEVESVDSARACLDRVAKKVPDLVITDLEMPGMSGIELCGALRSRYPKLVSIVVTGVKDGAVAANAVANGAVALLHKPVRIAALVQTIRGALTQMTRPRGAT